MITRVRTYIATCDFCKFNEVFKSPPLFSVPPGWTQEIKRRYPEGFELVDYFEVCPTCSKNRSTK